MGDVQLARRVATVDVHQRGVDNNWFVAAHDVQLSSFCGCGTDNVQVSGFAATGDTQVSRSTTADDVQLCGGDQSSRFVFVVQVYSIVVVTAGSGQVGRFAVTDDVRVNFIEL